ncbi:MAG: hypothetical protein GY701_35030, partial [Sulfitobacter sp.]|nr:hypothetical protein [Sulfitobacter sp.]
LAAEKQYDPEVVSKRLEFLLGKDADDPHAHTALGNIYASIDPEKARAHYEQALADPYPFTGNPNH